MVDNVNQGLKLYCGDRPTPPATRKGTPLQCFRNGIGVGKRIQEAGIKRRLRQERQRTETITRTLTKAEIARQIEVRGLTGLKRELKLEKLNKDLVRSLAQQYTGTDQPILRYSLMTKASLIDELVQRGFRR